MNKRLVLLIITALSFRFSLWTDEPDLVFNRTSWKITMESLTGDLSERHSYLKTSIPDLILRDLEQITTHVLTEKEKEGYREDIVKDKRIELLSELKKAYGEKDALLFNQVSNETKRDELLERIDQLRENLAILESFDSSLIPTADILPLEWHEGEGEGGLLLPVQYTPDVICANSDLDYLISGELRGISDYFLLEIKGFDPLTSKSSTIYSSSGSIEDMELMAAEAADELRSLILGRAWAALIVETNDPDSLIYSDGELIGIGKASIEILEPGEVFVEALGEDNSYWSEKHEITALERTYVTAELTPSEKTFVTVTSEPLEADVYVGSRWAGKTPLSLPRYKERDIWVTLRSEGFYDKSFSVSHDSPDELNFIMEVEELTRLEDFDLKKKAFYRSLGWFSLSVAAPMITAGIQNNYVGRQNAYAAHYLDTLDTEYYDLAMEMERNYYISTGVLIGTVAVSSGLLVDVFVKLARYIRAAEALAE